MKVTVIIPCHNYGRFLGEALVSLDTQDRQPDEITICDDGSSDDSWEIIQRLTAERGDIQVVRHPTAHGLVATFNELVASSTGDIVFPLSADDRYGSTYISRMVEDIEAKGWDFGYSDYQCFGAENFYFVAPEMDDVALLRQNFISGTSPFRRSLFDRIGGYDASFDHLGFEDWDFWIRAIEHGAIGGKVHGCTYDWRRHPGGSRNTVSRRQRVELRLRLLQRHPRFHLHPRLLRAAGRELRGRFLGR